MLIEECTEIHLFVGKAMNVAHRNSNLPFDLSIRMNLVEQLGRSCRKDGGNQLRSNIFKLTGFSKLCRITVVLTLADANETGNAVKSATAHSTVRDDEPCIPLCSDEFRMREGQEVGFSPKSGYRSIGK